MTNGPRNGAEFMRLAKAAAGPARRKSSRPPLGDGPGTELFALFKSVNVSPPENCDCEEYARKMNAWGAAGCREHFNEIIGHLTDARARWLWSTPLWTLVGAAAIALWNGSPLTIGGMLEEAIRRAEVKEVEKKNKRGRDAAGRRIVNLLGKGFCRGLGDAITWAWIAEGADEPLCFAAHGGVKEMLKMLGQRVVAENNGGLEVNECYKLESKEGCRRPRCEVWYEALGLVGKPKRPVLNVPLKPQPQRIALAPECEWKARTWPRPNWDKLSAMLAARGFDVLWILKSHGWHFPELARQIASCSLLIGNDSMPAHMAGTLDVPALVLFGPTRPPVLAHYDKITAIELGPKIERIPVKAVFDRAVQLMEAINGARLGTVA